MSNLNPYAAPVSASRQPQEAATGGLSMVRGFLIVLGTAGMGALLGLIVGGLLGSLAPDYYRAVFGNPNLNPIQVGTGLGLTQGFGAGFVVGCVVLLAVAISRRRQPPASVQS